MFAKPDPRDCIYSILSDLDDGDYKNAKTKLKKLADIKLTSSNDREMRIICDHDIRDYTFCKICGKEIDDDLITCSSKCQTRLEKAEAKAELKQKEITPFMKIGQWYFISRSGNQQPDHKIIFWRDGREVGAVIYELGQKRSTRPGLYYEEDHKEVDRLFGHQIVVEDRSVSKKTSLMNRGQIPPVSQTPLGSLSPDRQDYLFSQLKPIGSWSMSFRRKYKKEERIVEIRIYDTD